MYRMERWRWKFARGRREALERPNGPRAYALMLKSGVSSGAMKRAYALTSCLSTRPGLPRPPNGTRPNRRADGGRQPRNMRRKSIAWRASIAEPQPPVVPRKCTASSEFHNPAHAVERDTPTGRAVGPENVLVCDVARLVQADRVANERRGRLRDHIKEVFGASGDLAQIVPRLTAV